MKKEIYYSIRVVVADSTEKAIEKVAAGKFSEAHSLCDAVLTKSQLLEIINKKTKK